MDIVGGGGGGGGGGGIVVDLLSCVSKILVKGNFVCEERFTVISMHEFVVSNFRKDYALREFRRRRS